MNFINADRSLFVLIWIALRNLPTASTLIIETARWMGPKFFNRERESRIPAKSLFLFGASHEQDTLSHSNFLHVANAGCSDRLL